METRFPAGSCAACRNYPQYRDELRNVSREQVFIDDHWESYMHIQDLLKEYPGRMKLKEGGIEACPSCSCGMI